MRQARRDAVLREMGLAPVWRLRTGGVEESVDGSATEPVEAQPESVPASASVDRASMASPPSVAPPSAALSPAPEASPARVVLPARD